MPEKGESGQKNVKNLFDLKIKYLTRLQFSFFGIIMRLLEGMWRECVIFYHFWRKLFLLCGKNLHTFIEYVEIGRNGGRCLWRKIEI